ncbi:autotransporter outer membrane beta-barrel domain-containing protein [Deltaproteobacteria bacterium OttesenSCG-928-K17]|nr:autotransporter outer membrane beta-barrel domain-containing protein [Deltaproteobacteria bacterium OttesenSCG-928-K17]
MKKDKGMRIGKKATMSAFFFAAAMGLALTGTNYADAQTSIDINDETLTPTISDDPGGYNGGSGGHGAGGKGGDGATGADLGGAGGKGGGLLIDNGAPGGTPTGGAGGTGGASIDGTAGGTAGAVAGSAVGLGTAGNMDLGGTYTPNTTDTTLHNITMVSKHGGDGGEGSSGGEGGQGGSGQAGGKGGIGNAGDPGTSGQKGDDNTTPGSGGAAATTAGNDGLAGQQGGTSENGSASRNVGYEWGDGSQDLVVTGKIKLESGDGGDGGKGGSGGDGGEGGTGGAGGEGGQGGAGGQGATGNIGGTPSGSGAGGNGAAINSTYVGGKGSLGGVGGEAEKGGNGGIGGAGRAGKNGDVSGDVELRVLGKSAVFKQEVDLLTGKGGSGGSGGDGGNGGVGGEGGVGGKGGQGGFGGQGGTGGSGGNAGSVWDSGGGTWNNAGAGGNGGNATNGGEGGIGGTGGKGGSGGTGGTGGIGQVGGEGAASGKTTFKVTVDEKIIFSHKVTALAGDGGDGGHGGNGGSGGQGGDGGQGGASGDAGGGGGGGIGGSGGNASSDAHGHLGANGGHAVNGANGGTGGKAGQGGDGGNGGVGGVGADAGNGNTAGKGGDIEINLSTGTADDNYVAFTQTVDLKAGKGGNGGNAGDGGLKGADADIKDAQSGDPSGKDTTGHAPSSGVDPKPGNPASGHSGGAVGGSGDPGVAGDANGGGGNGGKGAIANGTAPYPSNNAATAGKGGNGAAGAEGGTITMTVDAPLTYIRADLNLSANNGGDGGLAGDKRDAATAGTAGDGGKGGSVKATFENDVIFGNIDEFKQGGLNWNTYSVNSGDGGLKNGATIGGKGGDAASVVEGDMVVVNNSNFNFYKGKITDVPTGATGGNLLVQVQGILDLQSDVFVAMDISGADLKGNGLVNVDDMIHFHTLKLNHGSTFETSDQVAYFWDTAPTDANKYHVENLWVITGAKWHTYGTYKPDNLTNNPTLDNFMVFDMTDVRDADQLMVEMKANTYTGKLDLSTFDPVKQHANYLDSGYTDVNGEDWDKPFITSEYQTKRLHLGDVTLVNSTTGAANAAASGALGNWVGGEFHYESSNVDDFSFIAGLRKYFWDVYVDDDANSSLKANNYYTADATKVYTQAHAAGITGVNQTFWTGTLTGMQTASRNAALNQWSLFGGVTYSTVEVKTGSDVDVDTMAFNLTAAFKNESQLGTTTVGAFIEYGDGDYDTYTNVSRFGAFKGKGDSKSFGVGLFAHNQFENGTYLEASVRGGNMENDYRIKNIGYNHNNAKSDTTYYGAHLGLGHIFEISEDTDLDIYGRLLWTHTEAYTTKTAYRDHLWIDAVDSIRTRVGGRLSHDFNESLTGYAGLAWEHEWDAETNGKIGYAAGNTDKISNPAELKASSAFGELGLSYKPEDSGLGIDFTVFGVGGQQKGFGGTLGLSYSWDCIY